MRVVSLREMSGGPCRGFSRTQVNYPQYIRNFDGPKNFLPTLVDYLSQVRKDGNVLEKSPASLRGPGYAVPMKKQIFFAICISLRYAILNSIKRHSRLKSAQ